MTNDPRFGLPLSLVEALRADPSPTAAALTDLLAEDAPAVIPPRRRAGRAWRGLAAGVALSLGAGAHGYAATSNLEGRWVMAPESSSFQEAVTGPAPDMAVVTVTRDDDTGLSYELVETRHGVEVARGVYDISFAGAGSTSSVGGARLQVAGSRDAAGAVVIVAPVVSGRQASIHMRRTGPDSAMIEHDIKTPEGSFKVEKISLVRSASISGEGS